MTLSVRCGYRKMQPIFCSFASGLPYRKTVKLHFCRISTIDLLVSIYENMLFRLFSSFLTAGNKSKCGTLQRLTHPQQSTDEPIFRPVSPPKRQAMQGKSFVLSPISTQTSSHLRKHRTSVPSRPQKLPGALIRTKSAPQTLPQLQPQPHPRRSSPVEWCNRFVSFGVGYALSWSGGSSCPVGWGVSRDLVRMSRLR